MTHPCLVENMTHPCLVENMTHPCLVEARAHICIHSFGRSLGLARFPHYHKLSGKEAEVNSAAWVLLKIHGAPSKQTVYCRVCNLSDR